MTDPVNDRLKSEVKRMEPLIKFPTANEYINYIAEFIEKMYSELPKGEVFPPGMVLHGTKKVGKETELSVMAQMDISLFLGDDHAKGAFIKTLCDMLDIAYPYVSGYSIITESWGLMYNADKTEILDTDTPEEVAKKKKILKEAKLMNAGKMRVSESEFKKDLITVMSCIDESIYTLIYTLVKNSDGTISLKMEQSNISSLSDSGGRMIEPYIKFYNKINSVEA